MRTSMAQSPNRPAFMVKTLLNLINIFASLTRLQSYISYTIQAPSHPIFFVLITILFHFLIRVPVLPIHFPPLWLPLEQLLSLSSLLHYIFLLLPRINSYSS